MMYNVGLVAGTKNRKHSYRRIAHQVHSINNNNLKKNYASEKWETCLKENEQVGHTYMLLQQRP